jgi:carbon-monoxide dehydrogenase small subunit
MTITSSLRVNGTDRPVSIEASDTLLTVLREQLFLLGAKRGCNQGVCGACTVLVDGFPVRSCLALAANCDGSSILTVEGFEDDPLGSRLQRAFASTGAVQCGFCTPGMLVAAHRLLADTPRATVADIQEGLSGNLCRCSGYKKIIDAVRQVSEESSS